MNLNRRIAALEAWLLAQPSCGVNMLEKIALPDREKQILKRAFQTRSVVVSPEEADQLDAAIGALQASDRDRVHQLMERTTIVVVSGADANL